MLTIEIEITEDVVFFKVIGEVEKAKWLMVVMKLLLVTDRQLWFGRGWWRLC
jgi:hypothetical protein